MLILPPSKYYTIGTKNFGGLKGAVLFRKVNGIVNVHGFRSTGLQILHQLQETPLSVLLSIYSDIGYIPNQIVLLHTENSTQYFPGIA
jgi:hypothetical protein